MTQHERKPRMTQAETLEFQKEHAPNIAAYIERARDYAETIVFQLPLNQGIGPHITKTAGHARLAKWYGMKYFDFTILCVAGNDRKRDHQILVGLGYPLKRWNDQGTSTVPWCVMFWDGASDLKKNWVPIHLMENVCKQKGHKVFSKDEKPKGKSHPDLWVELPSGFIIENNAKINAERLYDFLQDIAKDVAAMI